jgi:hypothetical protein
MPRPKNADLHPKPDLVQKIELLSAAGTTTRAIISLVGIGSLETLHKHYQEALDLGAEKANGVVGSVIYKAASKGEPWACQLIAKTRMGWKETNIMENTGLNGGPIQAEVMIKADATLTAILDELASLKAGSAKPG